MPWMSNNHNENVPDVRYVITNSLVRSSACCAKCMSAHLRWTESKHVTDGNIMNFMRNRSRHPCFPVALKLPCDCRRAYVK